MTKQVAKQRRPFHESIVDAIHEASIGDMVCLGKLIIATKIPKNHGQIIRAWYERMKELGDSFFGLASKELVPGDLASQKLEEEKTKDQKEIVTS